MPIEGDTKRFILKSAKAALLESGYAKLSTRGIAKAADVPLSQIHYHFGSKQGLVLAVLAEENRLLVERQKDLFGADMPLWKQWEQACDFLEDDLESGYVRVLQEMTAAGWSDPEIASAVRAMLSQWMNVLTGVAERAGEQLGGIGPYSPREIAVLAGAAFLGVEELILLGFDEGELPGRAALRKLGYVLRDRETAQ